MPRCDFNVALFRYPGPVILEQQMPLLLLGIFQLFILSLAWEPYLDRMILIGLAIIGYIVFFPQYKALNIGSGFNLNLGYYWLHILLLMTTIVESRYYSNSVNTADIVDDVGVDTMEEWYIAAAILVILIPLSIIII
jgi:hypothetical protein